MKQQADVFRMNGTFGFGKRWKLPEEAVKQLQSTLDAYQRLRGQPLSPTDGSDREILALRKALTDSPATLWWSDMAQAELCTVGLLTGPQAREALGGWRRRLAEVAGPSRYALYLTTASNLSDANVDPEMVRADLMECIRAVFYFYAVYGVAARSRSIVTKSLFRIAAVILVVQAVLALLLTLHHAPGKAMIVLVPESMRALLEYLIGMSALAVVGSVISVQRRLQDPTVDVDPMYRYIQTTSDLFSTAFVSPIVAAVFGPLAYGILATRLLSSSLLNFGPYYLPATGSDIAIVLVVGFLAGFAEQLVPDALTRIAARALGGGDSTSPPTTSTSGSTVEIPAATNRSSSAPKSTSGAQTPQDGAYRLGTAPPVTPDAAKLGQDSTLASEPNVAQHDEGDVHDANA